jgi:hypothetical protein
MPPAVRRCRRHAEGRRGGLHARSHFDCLDEREAAGQSELGVTVKRHPGPSRSIAQTRKLHRARIVKHVSGPLNAQGCDVAVEGVTLANERLELE